MRGRQDPPACSTVGNANLLSSIPSAGSSRGRHHPHLPPRGGNEEDSSDLRPHPSLATRTSLQPVPTFSPSERIAGRGGDDVGSDVFGQQSVASGKRSRKDPAPFFVTASPDHENIEMEDVPAHRSTASATTMTTDLRQDPDRQRYVAMKKASKRDADGSWKSHHYAIVCVVVICLLCFAALLVASIILTSINTSTMQQHQQQQQQHQQQQQQQRQDQDLRHSRPLVKSSDKNGRDRGEPLTSDERADANAPAPRPRRDPEKGRHPARPRYVENDVVKALHVEKYIRRYDARFYADARSNLRAGMPQLMAQPPRYEFSEGVTVYAHESLSPPERQQQVHQRWQPPKDMIVEYDVLEFLELDLDRVDFYPDLDANDEYAGSKKSDQDRRHYYYGDGWGDDVGFNSMRYFCCCKSETINLCGNVSPLVKQGLGYDFNYALVKVDATNDTARSPPSSSSYPSRREGKKKNGGEKGRWKLIVHVGGNLVDRPTLPAYDLGVGFEVSDPSDGEASSSAGLQCHFSASLRYATMDDR